MKLLDILLESTEKNYYKQNGNLSDGNMIKLFNPQNEEMGFVNLINMGEGKILDYDISIFDSEEPYFDNKKSLYLYDLQIHDNFKGNGHSKKLMNVCKNITKKSVYDYLTLITNTDNKIANNLYNKLGYKLYDNKDNRNFYYLKV
jgi:ribosomal protein S18 acetylase RimI-like enzyme